MAGPKQKDLEPEIELQDKGEHATPPAAEEEADDGALQSGDMLGRDAIARVLGKAHERDRVLDMRGVEEF